MKFALRFLTSFASSIITLLCCFDRVIFKGHLPIWNDQQLNAFVDYKLRMKRKDFLPWLEQHSQRLVDHARALGGEKYEFKQGHFKKERYIEGLIRERGIVEGLVAVLCVKENSRAVNLKRGKDRPWLYYTYRPQRVLYYYIIDPQFGLTYIRLETWFPFGIQVYVNGHNWLAQQMLKQKLGFVQHDNAFTALDDPRAAQKLANRFAHLHWPKQLSKWARRVNPLLGRSGWLSEYSYYWVIHQAEYATDILFAGREALRELYPRLIDHAVVNFSADDVLTFLGRKFSGNFAGEVLNDGKKKRWPGARVKHRMKSNWLKMYDKFGLILRVETVINDPREFRVRRPATRQGEPQMAWVPMNKGVANLPDYERHARAANERYLNALSEVHDPTAAYQQVENLTRSKEVKGRSYAGFNPARREDVTLFEAVLCGDFLLQGFRNADIREKLCGATRDARRRQKQANAVTRLLKRLHVRGLIAKIPRTRRWRITTLGQKQLGNIVRLHYHGLPLAV